MCLRLKLRSSTKGCPGVGSRTRTNHPADFAHSPLRVPFLRKHKVCFSGTLESYSDYATNTSIGRAHHLNILNRWWRLRQRGGDVWGKGHSGGERTRCVAAFGFCPGNSQNSVRGDQQRRAFGHFTVPFMNQHNQTWSNSITSVVTLSKHTLLHTAAATGPQWGGRYPATYIRQATHI